MREITLKNALYINHIDGRRSWMAFQKKRKNSKEFRKKFKKRFFTKSSTLALMIACLVLALFRIGTMRLRTREEKLDETIAELSTDIHDIEQKNKRLEEEKRNMNSDSFKEKIAREILGMIGKDEYKLEESDQKSTTEKSEKETTKTGDE